MSLEAALEQCQEEFMKRQYLRYLQKKARDIKQTAAAEALAVTESKQEDVVASAIPSVVEPVIKKRGRKPNSDEAVAAPIAC